jgi:hypothetical protein
MYACKGSIHIYIPELKAPDAFRPVSCAGGAEDFLSISSGSSIRVIVRCGADCVEDAAARLVVNK